MTQRMILINSPSFINEGQLRRIDSWHEVFGRVAPLELEIGCGTGHFVLELARRNPGTDYLAIDIFNRGCHKTCRKIDAEKLRNVRVLRAEARHLLLNHMPAEQLDAIYINCPDPWPKKRHRRRRLVNREFLRIALYTLRSAGRLYFSSDFADYAADVAAALEGETGFCNVQDTPVTTELPGYPKSKYMRRFLDQGQPIHFVHFVRDARFRTDDTLLPELRPGFRMTWSEAGNQ
jgi:tRNA (guanine-N7-)-methyltransferase